MYLLKEISINNMDGTIHVTNGIRCAYIKGKLEPYYNFWGKTEVIIGEYADWTRIKETKMGEHLLSYCNELDVKNMDDNFKKLLFNVSCPGNIEGYIIFIKFSKEDINCTGQKIFGRYLNEGVFVLKEGEYLNMQGHIIKVIDKQLFVSI